VACVNVLLRRCKEQLGLQSALPTLGTRSRVEINAMMLPSSEIVASRLSSRRMESAAELRRRCAARLRVYRNWLKRPVRQILKGKSAPRSNQRRQQRESINPDLRIRVSSSVMLSEPSRTWIRRVRAEDDDVTAPPPQSSEPEDHRRTIVDLDLLTSCPDRLVSGVRSALESVVGVGVGSALASDSVTGSERNVFVLVIWKMRVARSRPKRSRDCRRVVRISVATSPFEVKTTKRPFALISLTRIEKRV
jgi:hypothetical protein